MRDDFCTNAANRDFVICVYDEVIKFIDYKRFIRNFTGMLGRNAEYYSEWCSLNLVRRRKDVVCQFHRPKLQFSVVVSVVVSAAAAVLMFCCASVVANAASSPLVGKPISQARDELTKQGWQPALPEPASNKVEKQG